MEVRLDGVLESYPVVAQTGDNVIGQVKITDGDDIVDVVQDGTRKRMIVSDYEMQGFLNSVLQELKIMNLQLALMTDTQVTKKEIE